MEVKTSSLVGINTENALYMVIFKRRYD